MLYFTIAEHCMTCAAKTEKALTATKLTNLHADKSIHVFCKAVHNVSERVTAVSMW